MVALTIADEPLTGRESSDKVTFFGVLAFLTFKAGMVCLITGTKGSLPSRLRGHVYQPLATSRLTSEN